MRHEDNFRKEYTNFMKMLPQKGTVLDVPIPKEGKWKWKAGRIFEVQGIEDPAFAGLNGVRAFYYPKMKASKRRRDRVGELVKGKDGKPLRDPFPVPRGSMAVFTDKQIKVPFGYVSEQGLNFVDGVQTAEGVQFCYTVPKKNLFEVNRLALLMSNRAVDHFKGVVLRTWMFGQVRVMVVPYSVNRAYTGSKIVIVKESLSFDEELMELLKLWVAAGVIPVIPDFETSQGNLVFKPLDPRLNEYEEVDTLSVMGKQEQGVEVLEEQ